MYRTFQPGISTRLIIQERMFSTCTGIAVGQNCKAIKVDLFTLQSHIQGLFLFVSRKDICDRATDTEKFLERGVGTKRAPPLLDPPFGLHMDPFWTPCGPLFGPPSGPQSGPPSGPLFGPPSGPQSGPPSPTGPPLFLPGNGQMTVLK